MFKTIPGTFLNGAIKPKEWWDPLRAAGIFHPLVKQKHHSRGILKDAGSQSYEFLETFALLTHRV